jgi:hypothetical protein
MTENTTHTISWFVYLDGELIPREATMRGSWGYEVKCSCGWETRTGGATRSYVQGEARFHKAYPQFSS